jgi:hypothetical protein
MYLVYAEAYDFVEREECVDRLAVPLLSLLVFDPRRLFFSMPPLLLDPPDEYEDMDDPPLEDFGSSGTQDAVHSSSSSNVGSAPPMCRVLKKTCGVEWSMHKENMSSRLSGCCDKLMTEIGILRASKAAMTRLQLVLASVTNTVIRPILANN